MSPLKLRLLIDAVMIQIKRDKVTAEEAIAKYSTLSDEDRAALLAAFQ